MWNQEDLTGEMSLNRRLARSNDREKPELSTTFSPVPDDAGGDRGAPDSGVESIHSMVGCPFPGCFVSFPVILLLGSPGAEADLQKPPECAHI